MAVAAAYSFLAAGSKACKRPLRSQFLLAGTSDAPHKSCADRRFSSCGSKTFLDAFEFFFTFACNRVQEHVVHGSTLFFLNAALKRLSFEKNLFRSEDDETLNFRKSSLVVLNYRIKPNKAGKACIRHLVIRLLVSASSLDHIDQTSAAGSADTPITQFFAGGFEHEQQAR